MFTGYSSTSKAYRIYLGGGVWRESRDVVFLGTIRGAPQVGLSILGPPQQSDGYPRTTPHAVRIPFPLAIPGPDVTYFDSEVPEALNPSVSNPSSSNSPQQAFPGPSEEDAPEPFSQRSSIPVEAPEATRTDNSVPDPPAPAEDWRVLDIHRAMARGAPGVTDMLPQLARAQDVLSPGDLEPGKKTLVHLDGQLGSKDMNNVQT
jgi:hypothetical protein